VGRSGGKIVISKPFQVGWDLLIIFTMEIELVLLDHLLSSQSPAILVKRFKFFNLVFGKVGDRMFLIVILIV
jgi:hypothetical protein